MSGNDITSTVSAALVAAGVGLPPVWRMSDGAWCHEQGGHLRGADLDLTRHQTAAGLVRRLGAWAGIELGWATPEFTFWRRHHPDMGLPVFWAELGRGMRTFVTEPEDADESGSWVLPALPRVGSWDSVTTGIWIADDATTIEALAHIVEHIGRDHRIRRALGWAVEPGTLATLEPANDEGWTLAFNGTGRTWHPTPSPSQQPLLRPVVPALAGITDAAEALRLIDAAMSQSPGDAT